MASYKDKITSNGGKIAYFVKWYVDTPMKKRTKEDFDKNAKGSCTAEYEHAMSEWLQRSDVQDSILEYMKSQKFIKITNIYDSMCEKALAGDVNASKFVIDFSKSDFFSVEADEADSYLDGIDIPVLKKGK
jgi:hypothetical protein